MNIYSSSIIHNHDISIIIRINRSNKLKKLCDAIILWGFNGRWRKNEHVILQHGRMAMPTQTIISNPRKKPLYAVTILLFST